MSKRNKLQKFAELLSFPNVVENFDPQNPDLVGQQGNRVDLRGQWAARQFRNSNPITLELACGRGEYSLELARRFPDRNYIGVDIKGARIWKGASIALKEGIDNVAFLRTRIEQLALFFAQAEVDEIWITFPDPFLRNSKSNRRLTSARFLQEYRKMLCPGGTVNLKTDSPELYAFTHEVLAMEQDINILYDNPDIYSKTLDFQELEIKTYYERMHLADGRKIKFIKFQLG